MGLLSFASLYAMGGLAVGSPNGSEKAGMIAMFILFGLFYAGGFGAIGAVISAEVPHLRLRDKVRTTTSPRTSNIETLR